MRIRKDQSARRARVSEQAGLDVGLFERGLQQGIGAEEDLGGGEVVGDTLVCEEGINVDVLCRRRSAFPSEGERRRETTRTLPCAWISASRLTASWRTSSAGRADGLGGVTALNVVPLEAARPVVDCGIVRGPAYASLSTSTSLAPSRSLYISAPRCWISISPRHKVAWECSHPDPTETAV